MVWILSPYYSNDERMLPLMERISWCLKNTTKAIIDTSVIFE